MKRLPAPHHALASRLRTDRAAPSPRAVDVMRMTNDANLSRGRIPRGAKPLAAKIVGLPIEARDRAQGIRRILAPSRACSFRCSEHGSRVRGP
ncbi:Hypothetical protein A7982_10274 [Minicystis rosea]|nr:Hypothetical protein A7982_10274 [Minicystis rosea]